jgi:hypothetical protein
MGDVAMLESEVLVYVRLPKGSGRDVQYRRNVLYDLVDEAHLDYGTMRTPGLVVVRIRAGGDVTKILCKACFLLFLLLDLLEASEARDTLPIARVCVDVLQRQHAETREKGGMAFLADPANVACISARRAVRLNDKVSYR